MTTAVIWCLVKCPLALMLMRSTHSHAMTHARKPGRDAASAISWHNFHACKGGPASHVHGCVSIGGTHVGHTSHGGSHCEQPSIKTFWGWFDLLGHTQTGEARLHQAIGLCSWRSFCQGNWPVLARSALALTALGLAAACRKRHLP